MKATSCFILATAVASIVEVVAWNDNSSNSNRRFGVVNNNRIKNKNRRRRIDSQSAQSFATSVEQQLHHQPSFSSSTTAEILGMPVLHEDDESPTNTSFVESTSATLEYYPPRRIVADGARAMAVAAVSAAAIGGARHAIEMIAV